MNRYAYCGGNPISYVDPEGKFAESAANAAMCTLKNAVTAIGEFNSGVGASIAKAFSFGLSEKFFGDYGYSGVAYQLGKITGDTLSAAGGIIGLIISSGGIAGGSAAAPVTGGVTTVVVGASLAGATASAGIIETSFGDLVETAVKLAKIGSSGDKVRSLSKPSSNKEANKIAKEQGFENAEDLKEYFVGPKNISKFNIKIDKNTKEIILESIEGGVQIATGLFK